MPLLDPGAVALATQALHDLGLKGTLALIPVGVGAPAGLQLSPSWQVGLEQAAPADLQRLALEGFQRNEVVYACIREIAASAAEVRLSVLTPDGLPHPAHPLQRLLDRPNPEHSPFELIEALLTDLLVYGNAFLLKERAPTTTSAPVPHGPAARSLAGSPLAGRPTLPGQRAAATGRTGRSDAPPASGRPLGIAPLGLAPSIDALWKLRPDRIRIVPGRRRLVAAYVHRVGERETRLDPRDVIHLRLPDPADDLWGLSPVRVAARQIDTDNEASKFIDAFFRNAAVPFGIIKLKRALRGGEPEARRLGQRWTDRFRGLFGRFQVGVLDADADFQRIGLTQDEMAFPDLRAQTEARICAAFRVPPVLVGVKVGLDRSTFSNMAEARRFFWENTLLSLYRRLESKLTADLTADFPGPPVCLRFDFSQVAALRESRESIERSALAGLRAGALSVNDARRRFGLEPIPHGDALPSPAGPRPTLASWPLNTGAPGAAGYHTGAPGADGYHPGAPGADAPARVTPETS